jgi:PAS domain S-box-containing protein
MPGIRHSLAVTRAGSDAFPRRKLWVGYLCALGIVVAMTVQVYGLHTGLVAFLKDEEAWEPPREQLPELQEALTVSALMYAATLDPKWERRYRQANGELNTLLSGLRATADARGMTDALVRIDRARVSSAFLEEQAFLLGGQGIRQTATALLASERYIRAQDEYRQTVLSLVRNIHDRQKDKLRLESEDTLGGAVIGVVSILLLLVLFSQLSRLLTTERQQREEELRHARSFLQDVIDSLPLALFVKNYANDGRGEFILWNKTAERLFGTPAANAVGKSDADFFAPEEAAFFRSKDLETFRSGLPLVIPEEPITTGSQEIRILRTVKVPLLDEQGQPDCLVGISEDITERKLVETALQEKEEQLRTLVDSAQDGIVTVDHAGRIVGANQAMQKLIGFRPHELLGRHIDALLDEAFRVGGKDDLTAFLRQLVAQSRDRPLELAGIRAGGTRVAVEVSISEFSTRGRAYFTGILRDITERKRYISELTAARDEAEAANRAKSAFLAAMSHELRTPMNGIVGMVDLLHETALDGRQRALLNTVSKSSLTLRDIVDEVLDFSKIEAGKLSLECLPVSIATLLEEVAATLAPLARKKGLRLLLDSGPQLPAQVMGDPVRLRQVLSNLVSNAVKFTATTADRPGRVLIVAELANDAVAGWVRLRLRIADNGIGMGPEVLANLFQPFMQAESSTTRRFGGTGLGLSIAKRLVDLMDGEITVDSRPGLGSTFVVSLDLPLAEAGTDERPIDLSAERVLVLVGDPEQRNILCRYLEDAGARVLAGNGSDEVPELLRRGAGDAMTSVVLDGEDGEPAATVAWLRGFRPLQGARLALLWPHGQGEQDAAPADACRIEANPVLRSALLAAIGGAARAPEEASANAISGRQRQPSVAEAEREGTLILIAEDNETNREVFQEQLEQLGYAAELAHDGAKALAMCHRKRYGLILSDCHMPELDGFELTARLRAEEANSAHRIPIIAITASALKGDAERCLAAGFDDYLAKPIELSRLQAMLEKWLPSPATTAAVAAAAAAAIASLGGAAPETDCSGPAFDPTALSGVLGNDPELQRSFLARFVPQARGVLADMARAVEARQAGALAFGAHKLRSSARAVGANELADLCTALEAAGRSEAWEDVARLHPRMEGALAPVERHAAAVGAAQAASS